MESSIGKKQEMAKAAVLKASQLQTQLNEQKEEHIKQLTQNTELISSLQKNIASKDGGAREALEKLEKQIKDLQTKI